MKINFWNDEISDALSKTNSNAGLFWKVSNLSGLAALALLLVGILLIIAAIVLPALLGSLYGVPSAAPAATSSGGIGNVATATNELNQQLGDLLPILAMLAIILAGLAFTASCWSLAIVAACLGEYLWAAGNLVFWPAALAYRMVKSGEIRRHGLPN